MVHVKIYNTEIWKNTTEFYHLLLFKQWNNCFLHSKLNTFFWELFFFSGNILWFFFRCIFVTRRNKNVDFIFHLPSHLSLYKMCINILKMNDDYRVEFITNLSGIVSWKLSRRWKHDCKFNLCTRYTPSTSNTVLCANRS